MTRGRLIFIFASLLTVSLVISGTMWAATSSRQGDDGNDSLYKYLSVFTEVLGLVQRAYVDQTEIEILMAGAFEGTADALDPFSLYVHLPFCNAHKKIELNGFEIKTLKFNIKKRKFIETDLLEKPLNRK